MNEGINLLNPHKESTPVAFVHRIRIMRIITIGLLFTVSVSAIILFILVALSPLPALQNQEQSLRQTLSQSKNDIVKLTLVNERTSAIDTVLNKRKQLDQVLALIQSTLTGNATVTAIQGDEKSMTLTVESSSLQTLDAFLNGLIGFVQEKKALSRVILVDLTTDEANNQYAVTVHIDLL